MHITGNANFSPLAVMMASPRPGAPVVWLGLVILAVALRGLTQRATGRIRSRSHATWAVWPRRWRPKRASAGSVDVRERQLRVWTAISWLLPTAVALRGAWRGRRASGRRVGRAFSELPRWYLVAFLVPYVALFVRLWRPLPVRLSARSRLAASGSGAALSLIGMALIMWGRLTLGRMYNVSSAFGNRLYADQELVTSGPFGLVRHPMYVGALIAGLGGVLLYRTWAAVLVLAHETVFWVRAGREDQALAAEFGETWLAYARRVPAGIPVLGGPRVDTNLSSVQRAVASPKVAAGGRL